MTSLNKALRTGCTRASSYWQVLVVFYLANLGSAFILAILPALSLVGPGHLTVINQAAHGIDLSLLIDLILSPVNRGNPNLGITSGPITSWLQQILLVGLLSFILLPLIAWIPASLLSGGLFKTFAEAPRPFHFKTFLSECWHWFGFFLLLGFVEGSASIALAGLGIFLVIILSSSGIAWLGWTALFILLLLLIGWVQVCEVAGLQAVLKNTRNIFKAIASSFKSTLRNLTSLVFYYVAAFLSLGIIHIWFRLGIIPHVPFQIWPLAFFVQQAFILARLWSKNARISGAAVLLKELEPGQAL
jgi:hypothetical protein